MKGSFSALDYSVSAPCLCLSLFLFSLSLSLSLYLFLRVFFFSDHLPVTHECLPDLSASFCGIIIIIYRLKRTTVLCKPFSS